LAPLVRHQIVKKLPPKPGEIRSRVIAHEKSR
jgi:hypothetical protein